MTGRCRPRRRRYTSIIEPVRERPLLRRCDAEAHFREVIHDLSQTRLLALDGDFINRARYHFSHHWIEAVIVRRNRDLGTDLEAVGVVRILMLPRRRRA